MFLVLFLPTVPAQEEVEWVPTKCDRTMSFSGDIVPLLREIQYFPDGNGLAVASTISVSFLNPLFQDVVDLPDDLESLTDAEFEEVVSPKI